LVNLKPTNCVIFKAVTITPFAWKRGRKTRRISDRRVGFLTDSDLATSVFTDSVKLLLVKRVIGIYF
jgi:hypothetical protein